MSSTKSKKGWKYLLIIVVVIILLAIAGAAYVIFVRDAKSTSSKTKVAAPVISLALPPANQNYTSQNLNVTLSYPKGWAITDLIGSNILTVTSPKVNFINLNKQYVKGQITLTINDNQQPILSGFVGGDAVADIPSQTINYAQPTPAQQASTYLSFLNYEYPGSQQNTINAIFVTGNIGYASGQSVPETDIYEVSPIIYLTFSKCLNTACTGSNPVFNLPVSLWENSGFQAPIIDMFQSLQLN